ncbi:phage tail sheath C-terminal domain-containing protein [Spirosoma sp.]|uniref:phage tail sheath C-terminal domain-containing protein n=1 Tax=Spirosoma sp. TaxID=1899569 RepID=UPI00261A5397|nr:phage tail sheath C-terminal domain-containing protein [Spirosoma sp.]MCX6218590.1 phage tail sheath subtilisin-like domain-containing protein [Spirosoma sp.]
MAASYNTPGVYVEEIPKFPPSIAAVETAIPAFIGYTEKAEQNGESLFNKPKRIESIAEYEAIFGTGPSQNVTVTLDTNNQFLKAETNAKLYLYDSLRLFYANGGGKCYIISAGKYPANVASADLEAALLLLEQEDEPTIILSPDSVSDAANGPYKFQTQALAQCNKLKDRFTLCDLTRSTDTDAFAVTVEDFRDKIGINYLKYGAAYGPWIQANLPRTLLRRNLTLKRAVTNNPIKLSELTTDTDILTLLTNLNDVEKAVDTLPSSEQDITSSADISLESFKTAALNNYKALPDNANKADIETKLGAITTITVKLLANIQDRYTAAPIATDSLFKLRTDIDKFLAKSTAKTDLTLVAKHHKHLSALLPATDAINVLTPGVELDKAAKLLGFADGVALLAAADPADVAAAYASADTAKKRGTVALNPALAAANEAITFFRFLSNTQKNYEKTLNDALMASFGTYKDLVTKATEAFNLLPPSGAIAGVYATTDRDRGVWKAPANVSLNAVVGPGVKISQEQQGEYNVDVNSGKSINIIRAFTGKGTLVWGARTLAGNDNEWRYVPVRRFFNFVEESVKKASEQFVFEPNDANTWVKVQAMIENFLNTLWRQGALQGIKPEHAFYVAVGLGKTMTPLDILEGRMIIEIGMAAVRPAEFIILKFSHKMAES